MTMYGDNLQTTMYKRQSTKDNHQSGLSQERLTDVGNQPTDPERDRLRRFLEQLTGTEATLPVLRLFLFSA